MKFSNPFCMPNRWTFQMKPIRGFLDRWLTGRDVIVDPFCGSSEIGTHRNDLARGGVKADEFCDALLKGGVKADAVLFDPPYSPRQISECYKSVGLDVTTKDTQNSVLYKNVRERLGRLLKPGGVALSFGWNSTGFGKDWETREIMCVRHGGAHNDTICVAQVKP